MKARRPEEPPQPQEPDHRRTRSLGGLIGSLLPFARRRPDAPYTIPGEAPTPELTRRQLAERALTQWRSFYKMNEVADRIASRQLARQLNGGEQQLKQTYVNHLNHDLHKLDRPVVLVERCTAMEPQLSCACHRTYLGIGYAITGLQNPRDVLVVVRDLGARLEPVTQVRELPASAVHREDFTALDIHNLTFHPDSDGAMHAAVAIATFESYYDEAVALPLR